MKATHFHSLLKLWLPTSLAAQAAHERERERGKENRSAGSGSNVDSDYLLFDARGSVHWGRGPCILPSGCQSCWKTGNIVKGEKGKGEQREKRYKRKGGGR